MTLDLQTIRQGRATHGIRRVLTPEGVEVEFALAGRFQRLLAMLIDFGIQILLSIGLWALVLVLWGVLLQRGTNLESFLTIVLLIGTFFLQFFYYLTMEVVWQGRTFGKRLLGLRVVGASGQPLALSGLVTRNFMRQVEFFLPFSAVFGLVGPTSVWTSLLSLTWALGLSGYIYLDADRRRLGDLLGGTLVVREPRPVLLPDMAAAAAVSVAPERRFPFSQQQLETYGRFELQVLEGVLRDKTRPGRPAILARVVERITAKIGHHSPVPPALHEAFLNDFYAAQRQHLEREVLYGKRKDSKLDDEDKGSGP
jgi:uncharacterized RDD family membrane protein YckC